MISEERLAQLRFQAANNGYTPQYMGAMRKAGTVPKHGTPVTVISSELIQLVGAYDQLQASMRAAAATVPDGYNEDEIVNACMMAEVSDSKYEAIIAYLGDNRRAMLAANKEKQK